ncbi:C4-dicarboxylate ABC transporter [Pseudaestuariivita atlantica]|uniref:C4-dicarboxylate ABC transporter n=2 Tax=Pseudaestuariivita atlantica TaxID=1317121 RepID=A0A0L1JL72_9RHOB|nr:C4-dicarboxylate ABC transporter [Pseudaestuariivita atlantica]
MPRRVLILDDDREMRAALVALCAQAGWEAEAMADARRALDRLDRMKPDVILSDLQMPAMTGDALLRALPEDAPPLVVITAHGDVPTAVGMMQDGAYSFLEKPFDPKRLLNVLKNASEQHRLREATRRLKARLVDMAGLDRVLIGEVPAMRALRDDVLDLAQVDVPVLVRGATGTGKDVVARALHDLGPRADAPFLAVNCAALTEAGFAADLFGKAGAGEGLLAAAGGGTLFLDEVAAMPGQVQAGLLRVLETGLYRPVGATDTRPLEARIVSATHADLEEDVREGRFRADLMYRLNAVSLFLPPLAARAGDVALLHRHFLDRAARVHGVVAPEPLADDVAALIAHDWPGNLRELAHVAERQVLALRRGRSMGARAAIAGADEAGHPETLREAVAALERDMVARALREAGGRMDEAADRLGIGRRTLNDKIVKLNLDKDSVL